MALTLKQWIHKLTAPTPVYPIPASIPLDKIGDHTIESLTRLQLVRDICTSSTHKIERVYLGPYLSIEGSEQFPQVFCILMEAIEEVEAL